MKIARCRSRLNRLVRQSLLLWAAAAVLAASHPCLATQIAPLPQTGQRSCFGMAGELLGSCAGTGQDGESPAGVPWAAGRFTVNDDATLNADGTLSVSVSDALTGLAWSQDANAPGPLACNPGVPKNWPESLAYVKCLNSERYLGHSDWRLPNIKELWSLFDAEEGTTATWLSNNRFEIQPTGGLYWSSTVSPDLFNFPQVMSFADGSIQGYSPDAAPGPASPAVWPVRTSRTSGLVPLPQTGASKCYGGDGVESACAGTGQDGELQLGVPWSTATRFAASVATVDDYLTGLQWARQAPSLAGCSGGMLNWGKALLFVACLNDNLYLGQSDWRLPNLNELASLSNAGSGLPGWLTGIGFDLNQSVPYWSSSSYVQQSDSAWSVPLYQGGVQSKLAKTDLGNVLPVRTIPPKPGDADGDHHITVNDALQIYKLYLNPTSPLNPLLDVAPLARDGKPGGNGSIDLGDVITILRYLVLQNNPGAVQW